MPEIIFCKILESYEKSHTYSSYLSHLFKSHTYSNYSSSVIDISTQLFNSTFFSSFLVNPGDPDSGVVTDSGPPASPSLCSPGEKMKHFHDPTFPF